MQTHNFMLIDAAGTFIGAGIFSLIAIVPGYVAAFVSNILAFRSLPPVWRFTISIPVSVAIVPILAYWADIIGGRYGVWALLALSWIAAVRLLIVPVLRRRVQFSVPSRDAMTLAAMAIIWMAISLASLIDLQIGDRLYGSVTAADQSYRTAFTDAITRSAIAHPVNPFYYVEGPVALRYHYFWFILSSLVDQLGGIFVDARQAYLASVIWCGVALGCTIAAYLRFFSAQGALAIGARARTGILLLAVTGLDIIPTIILVYQRTIYPDMEWWNEAITSWLGSLLWVPHHIGGLVCGLIAFLIIWDAGRPSKPSYTWATAITAGIAMGTMLGESIYVGLVFAVFLSIWVCITYLRGWRHQTRTLIVAGLVALVVAVPYLKSLTGPGSGGSFIQFTVRAFGGSSVFGLSTSGESLQTYLVRLALLPLNYLIELGFFFVVGIVQIRRIWTDRLTPESLAATTLLLTSVTIATFFRSGVIGNNDLGWRGFLPAQFVLLIWAVEVLHAPAKERGTQEWRGLARLVSSLPLLLVIGLVSSIYSMGVLRLADLLMDAQPGEPLGRRMHSARLVYEQLRSLLPITSVVQQNPTFENPIYFGLYSNRQTSVGGLGCGTVFGGDRRACDEAYPHVVDVFKGRVATEQEVQRICREATIDVLIVTSGDELWNMKDSWMWRTEPLVRAPHARAYLIKRHDVPGGRY